MTGLPALAQSCAIARYTAVEAVSLGLRQESGERGGGVEWSGGKRCAGLGGERYVPDLSESLQEDEAMQELAEETLLPSHQDFGFELPSCQELAQLF